MLQEILEDEYLKMFPKGSHIKIMGDYLKYKKNPVVLEFGVERGSSTKAFIWLTKKMNGKVYSIDINDCSNVSNEKNWRFLQSDDLNIDYILEKFSVIKEGGVDLIYIDIENGEIPLYIEVLVEDRDRVVNYLSLNNVETRLFYPDLDSAIHLKSSGSFPNAHIFGRKGLVLPCGPDQKIENIDKVIRLLENYN